MTTTTTEVPPGTQAFYDRNLLDRAVPANVHGRFGQIRPLKSRNGNQMKFRRYTAFSPATTPLTEGVTPSGTDLAVTDVTATIAQYGDFTTITDMVSLTNQDPVLTEAGEVLGEQMGETADVVHRDVMVAGTNVIYSNGSSRAGLNTPLASKDLHTAIRFLNNQNAKYYSSAVMASTKIATFPIRKAYIGIVHPDTEAMLELISGYKSVSEYANQGDIMPDEIGAFKNIRFVRSTNAKVFINSGLAVGTDGQISTGAVNNDVYATLIIAKDAYGLIPLQGGNSKNIVKALGSAGTADPLDQRTTSGWKFATTTKILNEAWMTRIEHTNQDTLTS